MLDLFEHFVVNFPKCCPFKGARDGYLCLRWLWLHVGRVKSTQSEIPHQLSQRWVFVTCMKISLFRIVLVYVESHSALTESPPNKKNSNMSANSRKKSKILKMLNFLAYIGLILAKNRTKKPHVTVPLRGGDGSNGCKQWGTKLVTLSAHMEMRLIAELMKEYI
jgi:hypothetical protein